eukprot:Gb_37565 [translate_table: standard]
MPPFFLYPAFFCVQYIENASRDDVNNPGNNLYVTGLSARVVEKDLEAHFSKEGKVIDCRIVVDPRTRESRGFGFVTMDTLEDAERCLKYLNRSTLEGRIITVEKNNHPLKLSRWSTEILLGCNMSYKMIDLAKWVLHLNWQLEKLKSLHILMLQTAAKRKRARTPTPGSYLGARVERGLLTLQIWRHDMDISDCLCTIQLLFGQEHLGGIETIIAHAAHPITHHIVEVESGSMVEMFPLITLVVVTVGKGQGLHSTHHIGDNAH